MKYALERLYRTITFEIEPSSYADQPLQKDQYQNWITVASREKENISLFLQRKTTCTGKRKTLQLLIQEYQSTIIQLLDQVFVYKTNHPDHPLKEVYNTILQDLEQLLTGIEERYYRYFNLDEKVPRNYLAVCLDDLHKKANNIKKQLTKKGHDTALIKIALKPVLDLTVSSVKQITYRSLMYLKDLLQELVDLDNYCSGNTCYPVLIDMLMYLNFNSTPFKKYITDFICNDINQSESPNQKTEKIFFHLKEIGQLQERYGVMLHSKVQPIKESITGWLRKEVMYLENTQNLGIIVPEHFKEEELPEIGFSVGLTVDEIGLLLRAMKNSDLLLNKNTKKMIEDASKIFHTQRQYKISDQGLSKSYYNVHMNTVTSLSDKLVLLLNTVRKMGADLK